MVPTEIVLDIQMKKDTVEVYGYFIELKLVMSGIELTMKCAKYTIKNSNTKSSNSHYVPFNSSSCSLWCLYTGKCSMMFHTT